MAAILRATINSALPTRVARELLKYTMPNLVMAGLVTRAEKWSGVDSYGGVIQIPTFLTRPTTTQLNAGSDSPWTGSAETDPPSLTFSAPTISSVTLVIDQWWYYATQRTVYADAINNGFIDWDAIFKQGGFDGLKVKIDNTLTTLFSSLSTNVVGVDGTPPQAQDFVDAKKLEDALDVPEDGRAWVLSTNAANDITLLEAISNMMYVGDSNKPVVSGKVQHMLWGSNAKVTTNLSSGTAGKIGAYLHKQCMALAMRRDPFAFPALDNPNTASREVALFAIWGVKELRDNFGTRFNMN